MRLLVEVACEVGFESSIEVPLGRLNSFGLGRKETHSDFGHLDSMEGDDWR